MSCSSLPLHILKYIMSKASQADRARASAVSTAFQSAAVAAMEEVKALYCTQPQLDALQVWMQHHGQHVTRFVLAMVTGQAPTALPCPHLQELDLEGGQVTLASSSHGPGVLDSCMGLTRLRVSGCHVLDSLAHWTVLTALKDLEVGWLRPPQRFPGSALQHCSHITRLSLFRIEFADLHHISCLVDLQDLTVDSSELRTVTRSTLPGGLPASLRVLRLSPRELDPYVLLKLTNLEELVLSCKYGTCEIDGGVAGAEQLLTAIAGLKQLKRLELTNITCDWPPPSAAYSSLAASSHMTMLHISDCGLPKAAQELIFSPGQVLQVLLLGEENESLRWGQTRLKQLVSCCPALRYLGLSLQHGVDPAILQPLTELTRLEATFADTLRPQVSQAFACLTTLKHLHLICTPPLEASTLLPLTALRQLDFLVGTHPYGDEWRGVLGEDDMLESCTDPPDVWLQLLELCGGAPSCQPSILRTCVQQLTEQQSLVAQQQQQLAEQQVLLTQQQAQHTELREQLQQAMSQLVLARSSASAAEATAAAAGSDAAELRAQLQVLQEQVQQLLQQGKQQ